MSKHHRGGRSVPARQTTGGSGSKQNIMIRRQEEKSLGSEKTVNEDIKSENLSGDLRGISADSDGSENLSGDLEGISADSDGSENLSGDLEGISENSDGSENLSGDLEGVSSDSDGSENLSGDLEGISADSDGSENLSGDLKGVSADSEGSENLSGDLEGVSADSEGSENLSGDLEGVSSDSEGSENLSGDLKGVSSDSDGSENLSGDLKGVSANSDGSENLSGDLKGVSANSNGSENLSGDLEGVSADSDGSENLSGDLKGVSENSGGSENLSGDLEGISADSEGSENLSGSVIEDQLAETPSTADVRPIDEVVAASELEVTEEVMPAEIDDGLETGDNAATFELIQNEDGQIEQQGETFDTESGQMAFIEGVKQVEAEEEEPAPQEPEPPHPEQIAFVEDEASKKQKREKMRKEKAEKPKREKAPKKEMVKTPKKRGCCFHCCMTLLVFNFVCTLAILCVGWVIGDKYCQSQLGLSLTETFGVYKGITSSSGKIVDNRYSDSDEQGFYDSLGGALLLKEGTVNGEEFKETLGDGLMAKDGIGDVMLDYALDLLTRENLDQSKIDAIDPDNFNSDDTILEITDKELGAFLNGIVAAAADEYLTNAIDTPEIREYGFDPQKLDFKKYIKLDQTKFFEKNIGADVIKMLRATVSVDFAKAITDTKKALDIDVLCKKVFVGEMEPFAGLVKSFSGLAINLVKGILPSKLYLTVDVGLNKSVEPSIYINNMSDKKMNNFFSLLNVAGLDLKGELNKLFVDEDGAVKSVIDDINSTVDMNKIVTPGKLRCDVFDLVIGATGLNYETVNGEKVEKPKDRQITSADILGSLKLILSDSTKYVDSFKTQDYSYKDYKIEGGKLVKDETGKRYDAVTGDELDALIKQYEKDILIAFAEGYGLKTKYTSDDGYDLKDIIDKFSNGADTNAIMEMFDSDKLKEILDGKAEGIELTDRMIAALFMNMLPTLLEEANAGIAPDDVEIEFIFLEERKVGSESHNILNIALGLKFDSLLSGLGADEKIANLIKNLLADKFIITVGMDITLGLPESERIESEIMLNGYKARAIDKLLLAVGALPGENGPLSLGQFLDVNVISEVRKVIDGLSENLPGLKLAPSKLILPDIFNAITDILNKESDKDINKDDLKTALELIVNDGALAAGGKYAAYNDDNFAAYIQRSEQETLIKLSEEYGLRYEVDGHSYDLSQMLAILGVGDKSKVGIDDDIDIYSLVDTAVIEAKAFETENPKVGLTNSTLIEDPSGTDMFSSLLRAVVFGGMDVDFGSLGDDFDKENLLFAKISKENNTTYLTIAVKVNMAVFLDTMEDETIRNFMVDLLPDVSLIELKIDVTSGRTDNERKDGEIIINSDRQSTQALLKLLDSLDVHVEDTLSETCDNVRKAFIDFNESFEGIEYDTAHSLVNLPDIFTIISDVAFEDETIEASDVKTALKGIYTTSETEVNGVKRVDKFTSELNSTSVTANENYDEFMKDMRSKFYLTGEAEKATTFDELYEIVSFDGFDVDNINISGNDTEKNGSLAYDTRTLEELKPIIKLGDLGAIMQEKMPSDGKNYEIYSLDLRESDGKKQLVLYVKIGFDELFDGGDNDQMNKLINVQSIYAEIVANVDEMKESTDGNYYESQIVINGMGDDDMDSLFKVIASLSNRSIEDTKKDLGSMELDIGSAIYDAFNTLESSLGEKVTFKTDGVRAEHGIVLSDVFTFLGANICKGHDKAPASADIRAAIQGMYENVDTVNNSANYKQSDIIRNKVGDTVTAEKLAELILKASEGISDQDFGAAVSYMSTQNNNGEKIGEISQFSILASNGSGANQKQDRDALKALGYTLDTNKTFVLLTVTVQSSDIMGDNGDNNLSKLIKDSMYITFILEYGESNEFTLHEYVINNMSKNSRDALTQLIGIDQTNSEDKTVGKQAENSMKIVNELLTKFNNGGGTASFEDNTDSSTTVRGKYKVNKNS